MKYLLYDLGQTKEGNTIEILLGYAVNVRIMNEQNYSSFSNNDAHKFMGGYVERSPFKVNIPYEDHWYAIIEAGSFFSKIQSLVRLKANQTDGNGAIIIKPTVCELSPRKSLAKVTNFSDAVIKRKLKAFVLHYFKDNRNLAVPLALAFKERGLTVNYADYVLEPGEDLEKLIKIGLSKHKFGIIVFSRSMIKAGWKQSEIDYIKQLIVRDKLLFPVWQNVSKQQLSEYMPALEELAEKNPEIQEAPQIVDQIIGILMNTK